MVAETLGSVATDYFYISFHLLNLNTGHQGIFFFNWNKWQREFTTAPFTVDIELPFLSQLLDSW